MGRPAKALSGLHQTVGSNPTLSAVLIRRMFVCVLVFSCVVLFSSQTETRATCFEDYSVKRGDSWWSIAESERIALRKLLNINRATIASVINPGDTICLPAGNSGELLVYTRIQILEIIRDIWPDHLEDKAITIARRESKLQPSAIGGSGKCCYGLFQINYYWHRSWLTKIGILRATELLEPRANAVAALEIYRRNNGWEPWGS